LSLVHSHVPWARTRTAAAMSALGLGEVVLTSLSCLTKPYAHTPTTKPTAPRPSTIILVSYARFATSDVYVFLNAGGYYDCSGCLLQSRSWVKDPSSPFGGHLRSDEPIVATTFFSTADLLSHLDVHRMAGHVVPDSTYSELTRDATANDEWITASRPPESTSSEVE
jgi:hypothetical protein